MLKENKKIESFLYRIKKLIPEPILKIFRPFYHWLLAWTGAFLYHFPAKNLTVIGVTGTKGKSTVVYLASKIFEEARLPVAAIGSLGFKIKEKEWPNDLKMTMPGRFKIQKFLKTAKDAGCKFIFLEVTSEGIIQKRHCGIWFDSAVFTNLHPEHIESHGSFEKYRAAKLQLFKAVKLSGALIVNTDDQNALYFLDFPVNKKVGFGLNAETPQNVVLEEYITTKNPVIDENGLIFEIDGVKFQSRLLGQFNLYNILAALAIAKNYKIDINSAKKALEKIVVLPGRMEEIPNQNGFKVFVDYAHTPDSLEATYKLLKSISAKKNGRLICLFGATGGGRDKWKRPEMGSVAAKYCDEIILTTDDPYDENPNEIIEDVEAGVIENTNSAFKPLVYHKITDRKEAVKKAVAIARPNDVVVLSGKGSETKMVLSGGKKIDWNDAEEVKRALKKES